MAGAMPVPEWNYYARLVDVTDGDTIVVMRDLGDRIYQATPVRVRGVNSPEEHGETRAQGLAAEAFTRGWLAQAGPDPYPLVIETIRNKREKYGRLLARVWRSSDGRELADDLLAAGFAVPFMVDR